MNRDGARARRLRHLRPDAVRPGRLAAADQRLRHGAVPARGAAPSRASSPTTAPRTPTCRRSSRRRRAGAAVTTRTSSSSTTVPGALVAKTGYTDAAQHTFVGAITRGGHRYGVVLLRAQRWPAGPVAAGHAAGRWARAAAARRRSGTWTRRSRRRPAASPRAGEHVAAASPGVARAGDLAGIGSAAASALSPRLALAASCSALRRALTRAAGRRRSPSGRRAVAARGRGGGPGAPRRRPPRRRRPASRRPPPGCTAAVAGSASLVGHGRRLDAPAPSSRSRARSAVSRRDPGAAEQHERATSWIQISTARMPANGPAVGLFAVCAIVYVPTILRISKPTEASSAPAQRDAARRRRPAGSRDQQPPEDDACRRRRRSRCRAP